MLATQIPDGKMENPFLKTFGRPAREPGPTNDPARANASDPNATLGA